MSEWTIDTLREHFDDKAASVEKKFDEALTLRDQALKSAYESQRVALEKAEQTLEKRFDSVNEFRESLSDQQRTFIPRKEVEVLFAALGDRIDRNVAELVALRETVIEAAGRKNATSEYIAYFIALVAVIASVVIYLLKR